MKVIKEDIANLERCIENDKVNIVGSMPITMADAFYDSQKKQKQIDDAMKETIEENKDEKVIGAEKQPVPKKPEEPKATLEESLFEDHDPDIRHYSDMLFDMIDEGAVDAAEIAKDLIYWCSEDDIKHYMRVNYLTSELMDDEEYEENLNESNDLQYERIKNVKSYLEKALSVVDAYFDRIDESLTEAPVKDKSWKIVEKIGAFIDEGHIDPESMLSDMLVWFYKSPQFIPFLISTNIFKEEEIDEILNECKLTEDTEEDRYYAALDIPKGPERKKVAAERRKEFLQKHGLEDRAQEWKDAKGKDDPEEEDDLFTRINDELFPYDMEEVKLWTKFPEISASKRYHQGDIGTDYDGNILVWADNDEDFDFAKKVADAYGVSITEPKQSGKHKIVKIIIPEE